MKKWTVFCFLFCISLIFGFARSDTKAETYGVWGKLKWKLDYANTLTISGNGPMESSDTCYPWASVNKRIQKIVIEDGITSIGKEAFEDFQSLTSIIIANSVISIEEYAFEDCESLTSIVIPDGVKSFNGNVFSGCTNLTDISISSEHPYLEKVGGVLFGKLDKSLIFYPPTLSRKKYSIPLGTLSIGEGAFFNNNNIETLIIPDSVIKIGPKAFAWCSSLKTINLPKSITSIENGTFYGCKALKMLELPNCITSIGDEAFYWCESLIAITIPDGVTRIGKGVCKDCYNLQSIIMPNSLISIGSDAFHSCMELKSIKIPNSVMFIEGNPFWNCDNLSNIEVSPDHPFLKLMDNVLYSKIEKKIIYFPPTLPSKTYYVPEGVLAIGDKAFYCCSSLQNIIMPNSLSSIGDEAFYYCDSLISVTIPNNVTNIGKGAFEECGSLVSVKLPDGITSIEDGMFKECKSLTSIWIPDSITRIGKSAFSNCWSLQTINIPNDVICIGKQAFFRCHSLTSISIPKSVTCIEDGVFEGCGLTSVSIPDSVACIGAYAFADCDNLVSISIPNSVTSIGEHAFYFCRSLESIIIPEGVIEIGDFAFLECKVLKYISIPNTVEYIGKNPFAECIRLKEIDLSYDHLYFEIKHDALLSKLDSSLICYLAGIPVKSYFISEEVKSIGDNAFSGCKFLISVSIPNGVISIGDEAFCDCYSMETIEIPNSVTSIGKRAFNKCISLRKMSFPDKISVIEDSLMSYCESLESVVLPEHITSIGEWAFCDCDSLKAIMIPESVTSIGERAFFSCDSLIRITISDSVLYLGKYALGYHPSLIVNVPNGSIANQYCKRNGIKSVHYTQQISAQKAHFSIMDREGLYIASAGKSIHMIAMFENAEIINKQAGNNGIIWSVADMNSGKANPAVTINTYGELRIDKNLDEIVYIVITGISEVFGTEAQLALMVLPMVKKVSVEPEKITLYMGTEDIRTVHASFEPDCIFPSGLKWEPTKDGIVEITEIRYDMVNIKPVKVGKTDIVVREPDGKNARVEVSVVEPVQEVQLCVQGFLKAGGKVDILPQFYPRNVGNKEIIWILDVDKDIAEINEKGRLSINKNVSSGTKITIICMATGAPEPIFSTIEIEIP